MVAVLELLDRAIFHELGRVVVDVVLDRDVDFGVGIDDYFGHCPLPVVFTGRHRKVRV